MGEPYSVLEFGHSMLHSHGGGHHESCCFHGLLNAEAFLSKPKVLSVQPASTVQHKQSCTMGCFYGFTNHSTEHCILQKELTPP
jgi:hypothetical protein